MLRISAGAVIGAWLGVSCARAVVVDASCVVCVVGGAVLCPTECICVEPDVAIGANRVVVAYSITRRAVQHGVWVFGFFASGCMAAPGGSFILAGVALGAPDLWESVLCSAVGAFPDDG